MSNGKKLTVMVSSTVYGIEELLERIYSLLTSFGYDVWMSHKGTVPVFSNKSAFENCIKAVENCDLFLGIITPHYGSGKDGDGLSITHQELIKAIELEKPRWLLAHDHVIFARTLLHNLGYNGKSGRSKLTLNKNQVLDDLRVIDMYEDAVLSQLPLEERQGNWVQKFCSDNDATIFASAQFYRYQEVEAFLEENFKNQNNVSETIGKDGESS